MWSSRVERASRTSRVFPDSEFVRAGAELATNLSDAGVVFGVKEIPVELDEAARVEGCSSFGIFYKVALPLAGSGLVAAGILVFTFTWNEYLFALCLAYQKAITIPLQIAGTGNVQGIQFWITSVRGLVAVIPPVVLAIFAQRFIVRGLTFGALKG